RGNRRHAGADLDAVGEHRAGAALGEAAAEARSFELELVREHVEERRVRAGLDRPGSAVHFDLELVRHAHPPVDQMRSVVIRMKLGYRSRLIRTSSQAAESGLRFLSLCT